MKVKNNIRGRLSDEEKVERMIAVAEAYFKEGRLLKEIAKELSCTTTTVSRILQDAFKANIIDVKINREPIEEIRQNLIARFGLLDARLSPYLASVEGTRHLIAAEAAKYFDEMINDHKVVGISGGRTLHRMIDVIGSKPRYIKIYPLTGLWRDLRINYVDSGALVHYLWLKCEDKADAFWFPMAPIPPDSDKEKVIRERITYMANPEIRAAYQAAGKVDLAFIGVAPLRKESSTIRQLENIGVTYQYLNERGAVGIAGGVWFNKDGERVIDDYFLSVRLDAFRKMVKGRGKKAVVVAGGDEKVEAIRVFLQHKICNVLITDGRTASMLLQ